MGDPLSVAASVAGLLSVALQSTEYLYKYYTVCRDQHRDLVKVADQLGGLRESLQIIDDHVRTRTWRVTEESIIRSIERSITRSEDAINALQAEVGKFKKEPADDWRKKAVVVGRRAAYPFKRSTLEDLGDDVSVFRNNLSIALDALQLKEHKNTQSDIEEVNAIVKNLRVRNVSADLLQWLRAPDATVNFNIAVAKRHPSTGNWLVQGPAYTAWLQQDNSFLWLYGFAGCGKSVLCSTAIQHAFRRRQSSAEVAVAFFFFDFRDESKQDASAALRALLLQLCTQIPGLQADLARLRDSYNHGTPPVPVLLEYLRQAVVRCRQIYILLDALDESPADVSRAEVLRVIDSIRQWQLPGLHLLVTSRDVPDIRDHLQISTLKQGVEHISLKNDSVQQDISRFVAFQLDHDLQLQRWGVHQEKIKSYLIQHAGGVFRWVECQLRPLRLCPRSERRLDICLRALPKSLDETYERILCSIESREEAQQLLSLLCFAPQPLSVGEVTEALAVDIDDLECYDPMRRFTGGADDVLRICPGLIELSLRADGVQEIRIEHFSVQEYLQSDRIRTGRAADFALLGPPQHGRISKACLLYLKHDEFLQQKLSPDLVRQYAFARYAAEHWYYHYRQADSQFARQLSEMAGTFLTTRCTKERWIRLHNPEEPWSTDVRYHEFAENNPSATYYASLLGLDEVLMFVVSKSAADVNARGGKYGNALQAALICGHESVVQILLDKGALDAGGEYGNALYAASMLGHKKVVQMLLDKGADVEFVSALGGHSKYSNALSAALKCGHEKVVQILLDKGAVDINTPGGEYTSALYTASARGYKEVVQILLDKGGVDINIPRGETSALYAASTNGHVEIVQILLDKCAVDVNAPGVEYGNALCAASARGHVDVVRILLDTGVIDVNALGGEHGNALCTASGHGHVDVVQMLLDKGADVNAPGGEYGNALCTASGHGHVDVVQMLLDKGGEYGNALELASWMDYGKIVQMLLEKGAVDVNAQGGRYGNALYAASAKGHEEVVQLLLDKGAVDVNAPGGE
ncbi:hypothetical protein LTR99_004839 [Exophiala xenobiotica]|nr:hypothetical protein LTR99_004839 [Exophiala xenobiotica]